jgi:hypothetical protein
MLLSINCKEKEWHMHIQQLLVMLMYIVMLINLVITHQEEEKLLVFVHVALRKFKLKILEYVITQAKSKFNKK